MSEALRPVAGPEANRLERILGRPERPLPLDEPLRRARGEADPDHRRRGQHRLRGRADPR